MSQASATARGLCVDIRCPIFFDSEVAAVSNYLFWTLHAKDNDAINQFSGLWCVLGQAWVLPWTTEHVTKNYSVSRFLYCPDTNKPKTFALRAAVRWKTTNQAYKISLREFTRCTTERFAKVLRCARLRGWRIGQCEFFIVNFGF